MKRSEIPGPLQENLEQLEQQLETPLVPGELVAWSEALEAIIERLQPLVRTEMGPTLADRINQIETEDPGLSSRAELLAADGADLLRRFQIFAGKSERLAATAGANEPAEMDSEQQVEELSRNGLELVIGLRKQETATATWLDEALNRDRGEGD